MIILNEFIYRQAWGRCFGPKVLDVDCKDTIVCNIVIPKLDRRLVRASQSYCVPAYIATYSQGTTRR
jgi:hypothetical protein